MKICWDNLEPFTYIPEEDCWRAKNKGTWYYKEECEGCGEPYLVQKHGRERQKFCCKSCSVSTTMKKRISNGWESPMKGKKHTKETRKKISDSYHGQRDGKKNTSWKGGYSSNNIPTYETFAPKLDCVEECRRDPVDKNILQIKCCVCDKWHTPTISVARHRILTITGRAKFGETRFYCSEACKNACSVYNQFLYPKGFGKEKRTHQEAWAKMIKERAGYKCEICGKPNEESTTIAHHLEGIKQNPLMSTDLEMGIALCGECHDRAHSTSGCTHHNLKIC